MKMEPREAAFFILGYFAALTQKSQRIPKYLLTAAHEARDVVSGGSFRGPLAVYEMTSVAEKLAASAAIKASKKDKATT